MKYKLEAKDMDIKELKKMVKMKQEELSEMQASTTDFLIGSPKESASVTELENKAMAKSFFSILSTISMWLLVCISLLKTSLGCRRQI